MLAERIIATIRFFDLQDYPLTAFEVHKYLLADVSNLQARLDEQFELLLEQPAGTAAVHLDTVQKHLDQLAEDESLVESLGFYALPDRHNLIKQRLKSYLYGIPREQIIRRYGKLTAHIPFVRSISLAGSQALGLQRPTSDIDFLIITDPRYMWIARSILTVYFHLLGVRRYGNKIANRVCLNHYLANIREVDTERNLYKAMEYAKLRPVVYPQVLTAFQKANEQWIRIFFPNITFSSPARQEPSKLQEALEKLFTNRFGLWLERKLERVQLARIRQGKFIFVREDELSFHPDSKHEKLLQGFFKK